MAPDAKADFVRSRSLFVRKLADVHPWVLVAYIFAPILLLDSVAFLIQTEELRAVLIGTSGPIALLVSASLRRLYDSAKALLIGLAVMGIHIVIVIAGHWIGR